MADEWDVEEIIDQSEKYDWHLPNNEDQHSEQTVAPGDLMVKPEDLDLVATLAPKQSGVQHGVNDWTYENAPDSEWFSQGSITDGFDYYFDLVLE